MLLHAVRLQHKGRPGPLYKRLFAPSYLPTFTPASCLLCSYTLGLFSLSPVYTQSWTASTFHSSHCLPAINALKHGTRKYHSEWGNSITKEHTCYELADKWILALKLRISKIQFTDHMKLKKNEDQSVDTLILIGRWIKIPMAHSQPIDWA